MKKACAVVFLSLLIGVPFCGYAQTQDLDEGIEKVGVIHNIAGDRLVENVWGIYQPEGIDKYMKRRFDQVEGDIAAVNAKLAAISKQIEGLKKTE